MNVASINRVQNPDTSSPANKLGVIVAQKAIEAARLNQASGDKPVKTGVKQMTHPYLGHNIDIFI